MAVLACAYGVLKAGSIWYPINLLAAAVYAESLNSGPNSSIHFMRTVSELLWSSTSWCLRWSDCSMERCCPCSRGVRSCLGADRPGAVVRFDLRDIGAW